MDGWRRQRQSAKEQSKYRFVTVTRRLKGRYRTVAIHKMPWLPVHTSSRLRARTTTQHLAGRLGLHPSLTHIKLPLPDYTTTAASYASRPGPAGLRIKHAHRCSGRRIGARWQDGCRAARVDALSQATPGPRRLAAARLPTSTTRRSRRAKVRLARAKGTTPGCRPRGSRAV